MFCDKQYYVHAGLSSFDCKCVLFNQMFDVVHKDYYNIFFLDQLSMNE